MKKINSRVQFDTEGSVQNLFIMIILLLVSALLSIITVDIAFLFRDLDRPVPVLSNAIRVPSLDVL